MKHTLGIEKNYYQLFQIKSWIEFNLMKTWQSYEHICVIYKNFENSSRSKNL